MHPVPVIHPGQYNFSGRNRYFELHFFLLCMSYSRTILNCFLTNNCNTSWLSIILKVLNPLLYLPRHILAFSHSIYFRPFSHHFSAILYCLSISLQCKRFLLRFRVLRLCNGKVTGSRLIFVL